MIQPTGAGANAESLCEGDCPDRHLSPPCWADQFAVDVVNRVQPVDAAAIEKGIRDGFEQQYSLESGLGKTHRQEVRQMMDEISRDRAPWSRLGEYRGATAAWD